MCLGLFLSTYLLGYAPTTLKASKKLMNLIAIFGAGLLVGAALEIIVPEGMSVLSQSVTMYEPTNDRLNRNPRAT